MELATSQLERTWVNRSAKLLSWLLGEGKWKLVQGQAVDAHTTPKLWTHGKLKYKLNILMAHLLLSFRKGCFKLTHSSMKFILKFNQMLYFLVHNSHSIFAGYIKLKIKQICVCMCMCVRERQRFSFLKNIKLSGNRHVLKILWNVELSYIKSKLYLSFK